MRSMLLVLGMAALAGCGDDGTTDGGPLEGGTDSAADGDLDAGPAASPGALILDTQLSHIATWVDVIEALDGEGLSVDYRRYYPHLTPADVAVGADGRPVNEIIVMAAGRAPGIPADQMRFAEVTHARRYVEAGGVLVLAAQSGMLDSVSGENDWFIQNRILEELGLPVRVGRGVVLGDAWVGDPAPPHIPSREGYPTTLEATIGYPFGVTPRDHPTAAHVAQVACGSVPRLHVAGDEAEVLLRTHPFDFLWQRAGGSPDDRVILMEEEEPLAAAARAADGGFVVVLGRSTLTLGAVSGAISDKPAHEGAYAASGREWLQDLLGWLHALAVGEAEWSVTSPLGDDVLFSVSAPGVPPFSGGGEVIGVSSLKATSVPDAPPPGDHSERLGRLEGPPPGPDWLSASGGRIAYGGLPPAREDMATAFGEVAAHGLDALLTTTQPERLHGFGLSAEQLAVERTLYAEVGAMAEAAGQRWIIGGYLTGSVYAMRPDDFPSMMGAQGQEVRAPAPLDPAFWEEAVIPTYRVAGELARDNPGVFGLHIDMELYGGPVFHSDGYAFSDSTVEQFLAAFEGTDLSGLSTLSPAERLDWLLERGALGDYMRTLEGLAYELGVRCRTAAHENAPGLWLTVYVPLFPTTWLYHGFLRGLGTAERPAVVLSYEAWTGRALTVLRSEGLHLVHLGGTLVSYFEPSDFQRVLTALGRGNDGYWYLSFNDFSETNPMPPPLHGPGAAYWTAVDTANTTLEAGP